MYHSINKIDQQLFEKYPDFQKRNGIFIEAGANNGITQSNTYFFENELFWRGILIEPVSIVFRELEKNRSQDNIFINAALVANDYHLPEIVVEYTPQTRGLMSTIKGIRTAKHHLWKAGNEEGIGCMVKALTLNQIFENSTKYNSQIDFFSLDVEGYEVEALSGIKFDKYAINYLLIEQQYNSKKIDELMSKTHQKIDQLSEHDFLWKLK